MDLGRCLTFRNLGRSKYYLVLQQIYTCILVGNLHELVATTTILFSLFLHSLVTYSIRCPNLWLKISLQKPWVCTWIHLPLSSSSIPSSNITRYAYVCVHTHVQKTSQLNKVKWYHLRYEWLLFKLPAGDTVCNTRVLQTGIHNIMQKKSLPGPILMPIKEKGYNHCFKNWKDFSRSGIHSPNILMTGLSAQYFTLL